MNNRFKFRCWDDIHREMIDLQEQDVNPYNISDIPQNNIMQCTGLKDKNGNLIYEGDIIKDLCIDYICTVVWRKAEFALKSEYGSYIGFNAPEQKVIGNIYQNPELLEE